MKCIRKIIFRIILNKNTIPLETGLDIEIGYYNIIIIPIVKLVERYGKCRDNTEEENHLKKAITKAVKFWLQTEKKHPEIKKETLQKMVQNELWMT